MQAPFTAHAKFVPTRRMPQGVILGLVPRIKPSADAGARGWLDGRDKPDHDTVADACPAYHFGASPLTKAAMASITSASTWPKRLYSTGRLLPSPVMNR